MIGVTPPTKVFDKVSSVNKGGSPRPPAGVELPPRVLARFLSKAASEAVEKIEPGDAAVLEVSSEDSVRSEPCECVCNVSLSLSDSDGSDVQVIDEANCALGSRAQLDPPSSYHIGSAIGVSFSATNIVIAIKCAVRACV